MATIIFNTISKLIAEHPYQILALGLITTAFSTRIISAIKYKSKHINVPNALLDTATSKAPVLTILTVPYYLPFLGHVFQFILGFSNYVGQLSQRYGIGVFALNLGGKNHNMIISPSLAKQIMFNRNLPIRIEGLVYHFLRTLWNDGGEIEAMDPKIVWGDLHKVSDEMLREEFITTALRKNTEALENGGTYNLISGSSSWVDMSTWEREAQVEILESSLAQEKGVDFIAEANLHSLVKNFVGEIAVLVLLGQDFMNNNPSILSDLWLTDSKFNAFLLGLPYWFPGMISASAARDRIVASITEHHYAHLKYLDGEDPGSKWSDMSDVSNVMTDRAQLLRKINASPKVMGVIDATVLWAMNVNSNHIIFWMLFYFYRDPKLLAQIRAEVAPYVTKEPPSTNHRSGIKEPQTLKINLTGLRHSCPLLQGSFVETMRLEASSASYKYIDSDFVLTESAEDVNIISGGKRNTPTNHLFRKGEYVCIPHGAHQNDPRYFPEPEKFDPRRFWVSSSAVSDSEKAEGKQLDGECKEEIKVDLKTMKVWGGGKTMCRGRKFAEGEVVLFVAAIIMCWEMEPVEGPEKGWRHPGRIFGSGAVHPKKDIRVRMWRREW